jgi:hypothetical protein
MVKPYTKDIKALIRPSKKVVILPKFIKMKIKPIRAATTKNE